MGKQNKTKKTQAQDKENRLVILRGGGQGLDEMGDGVEGYRPPCIQYVSPGCNVQHGDSCIFESC